MSGRQNASFEDIKTAIAEGSLTQKEIERRLESVVAHEIDRKDGPADLKLVDACLDLLCEIQTHGQFQFESHASKNKMAVLDRYERYERRRRRHVALTRVAAVTAALCVCVLGIEIVFHREFFVNSVTPDEQQYYVQGVVENPNIVKDGQADNAHLTGSLKTTDINEAIDFLGFEPSIPKWLPEGWMVSKCSVYHQKWYSRLFIDYNSQLDKRGFSFEVRYFEDIKEAYASFEQNVNGMERVAGESEIYCSINEGDVSYIWCLDNAIYALYRADDNLDPLRIIESVANKGE